MKDNRIIKVLLVSPFHEKSVGGIGTWTKLVLDYYENRKDVCLIFQNTVNGLPKRQSQKNRLYYLYIGIVDSLLIHHKLIRNMMRYKPDIVHYTSSAGNALYKDLLSAFIVRKLFKKKFVIHWRFGRIPQLFQDKNKEYKLLAKTVKRVDMSMVLDSDSLKCITGAGCPCVLIPNPMSSTIQKAAENNKVIDRNSGEVLFVGHMLRAKGIFELVQSCIDNKAVKKLIMIGPFFDEDVKKEITELSRKRPEENWIEFKGEIKREEVWDYYRKCSVFCLPSYTEGFPNVIIEAMAFSCPIVATKVGAIPEMLSDGCGLLVDSKQVESLKNSLEMMLDNSIKANEMGQKAHAKAMENYTIEKVYDSYCNVWGKLV